MASTTYVYAGGVGGLFRGEASGLIWERLTNGMPEENIRSITVDTAHPEIVFVGTDHGPYRSKDQGANWIKLPFPETDTQIWSILIDPHDPRRIYAGGSPVSIFRSTDAGDSWERLPDPNIENRVKMPFPCRVMRLVANPRKPNELYATLEVNGVIRSSDGGMSWQDCSDDLVRLADQPHLKSQIIGDSDIEGMLDGHALCITQADPDAVILAVRMGLFRSGDQGGSWRDMEVGRFSPVTYARDIRVSPQDPKTLFACLSVAAASDFGSLYRSQDIGNTWQRIDAAIQPTSTLMAVALHPSNSSMIFSASRHGQVFGTVNNGTSWIETQLPASVKDVYALACG